MRIGIAGPGRSGTTLLVRLFSEFGFRAPAANGAFDERAQAGFESRIDGTSEFEVDKDPWFYEYVNFIPTEALKQYELILIPIRNRQDAVVSRVSIERASRALERQSSQWTWNTSGSVPGGAVYGIDSDSVNRTLSAGLWDLIEACERLEMPYKFIHFPKFVLDFEYFWSSLGDLIERKISKDKAKRIFEHLVDPNKIVSKSIDSESIKIRKLETIISILQKENFMNQRILLEAISDRDSAISDREKILHSKTWRLFGIYRQLKSYIHRRSKS